VRPLARARADVPEPALDSAVLGLVEGGDLRALNDRETSFAHPTAVVDPRAGIGDGVLIGPYVVIGGQVSLGDGTQVGAHAVVDGSTRIGQRCRIYPSAMVGLIPQDLKYDGCDSRVEIGDDNVIREFVTVHRATSPGARTSIGNKNLLMAYVHIAHDCHIGDGCILANCVQLAGHVTIEDQASVGGLTPVHQFVRIGRHAFVGGGSRVAKDVPPYVRAAGNPLRVVGLNSIGLERRGFAPATIAEIKRAYRLLYRSQLNVTQAIQRIRDEVDQTPEVRTFVEFLEATERGIEC
jgi:UDP-N-acetylglucosamine acyltransferase